MTHSYGAGRAGDGRSTVARSTRRKSCRPRIRVRRPATISRPHRSSHRWPTTMRSGRSGRTDTRAAAAAERRPRKTRTSRAFSSSASCAFTLSDNVTIGFSVHPWRRRGLKKKTTPRYARTANRRRSTRNGLRRNKHTRARQLHRCGGYNIL